MPDSEAMPLDDEAVALLRAQHGLVTSAQLRRTMTAGAVKGMVRRGRLFAVDRGVYRSAECPALDVHPPLSAALRAGDGAAITGPVALAVRGVAGVTLGDPWEVLLPRGVRRRGLAFPHRPWPEGSHDLEIVDGLPVAPPVVALVDCGRWIDRLGRRRLRLALDSCRWKHLVTTRELREHVRRLGDTDPGARVFLEWDARGELTPESDGERRLGHLLVRIAPLATPQANVAGRRIDWYWRDYGVGYEYQGTVDHRSAIDRLADTERAHVLLRHGVEVHLVVAGDLRDGDAFVRRTLRLLAGRARELDAPLPRAVTGRSNASAG